MIGIIIAHKKRPAKKTCFSCLVYFIISTGPALVNTVYTSIRPYFSPIQVTIFEAPNLTINNPAGVCIPQKIDITDPAITAGSDPGLIFSYWKNQSAITPLPNANAIDKSGTYYIMASKPSGCSIVKPVLVKIGSVPNILIHNPSACAKVNISDTSVTSGSTPGIAYSYWTDPAATVALTDINNITVSGTYYLIASATSGCSIIRPVIVIVNPLPVISIVPTSPTICSGGSTSLTASGAGTGSYTWSPTTGLSCTTCATTIANPTEAWAESATRRTF